MVDNLFADFPDAGAAAAPNMFADFPAAGEKSWGEGFSQGVANLQSRIESRAGQMGSQFMLEQTAQRAADRKLTFGEILEDAQLSSGMTDMQGKPLKTYHGGEYISAAARWIDARYADLIGTDDEKAADEYAASMQKNMDAFAKTPKSEIAEKFQKRAIVKDATLGQTLSNFGAAIIENPVGGLSWALETAGESLPTMVGAIAGTALTKNPQVGITIMGGGSYATERYTSPGEFFQEKGLNLNKPEDRERLLNDPKLMKEAAERGVIRGLIIGAFDALSGGVAGQTLMKNPLAEAVAQSLTQAILGAGGEYTGRLAAGQEMDWGEVIAEAIAELPTLPLDMIAAGRGQEPAAPPGTVPPEATPAETVIPPEEPPDVTLTPEELAPEPAPTLTPEQSAALTSLPTQIAEAAAVPDSPRLTEADRRSPIPNELQDEGKAAVEAATGKPSTFTTTAEFNGRREVVTGNVSDLVSQNRAETAAVTAQIMEGVSTPEILAGSLPAAPPARAAEVPAPTVPTGVPAAPRPPVAEPPIEDVSDEAAPRTEDTESFEEWVAKSKAHIEAREAKAREIAAAGRSVRMEHPTRTDQRALVGPDMAEPGKFRITRFDKQGPFGHTTFNTLEEAANEGLRDGYVVTAQPTAQPAPQAALKDKLEANRAVTAPEQPPKVEMRPVRDDVAITPAGRDVPITYAVVEADSLIASQRDEGGVNPAYPAELQPRDRSRAMSDAQIADIASNLDPRLLDQNPNASDGAPIVSEEGVVESGNGRVLAIRRAFNQGMPTAQGYVDYLAAQGYPVQGMQRPVLVRVRQGQLPVEERAAFTREANERTTLKMSEPEQAMADAAAMRPEVVSLFRGGEVEEAGNRDFVRAFMQSVVGRNERAVTAGGALAQESVRRIRNALLAKAYGDADLVSKLVESLDNNIKAIGGAMMDVAGQWAQMRSEAAEGRISPDTDVTRYLIEAVRLVQRARNEGRPLAEYVAQTDIFSGTTVVPEAVMLLRLMFRNEASWTQPVGREKLAEALGFYTGEARKTTAGTDLLGEAAPPAHKILAEAKRRQYGAEEKVQQKLALGGRTAGKDTGAPSAERAVEAQPRPQAEKRAGVSPEVRAEEPTRKVIPKDLIADIGRLLAEGQTPNHIRAALRERIAAVVGDSALAQRVLVTRIRDEIAAEKARPAPKFKRSGLRTRGAPWNWDTDFVWDQRLEPAPRRLTKEEQKEADELEARLSSPEIAKAVARMNAQPDTSLMPGYGTKEWWANRLYNWGKSGMAGTQETIRRLVMGAKTLAVDEINNSRRFENKKRAEAGLPLLEMEEDYVVEKGYRAVILMGPPGAGKSSAANPIAVRMKAAISDVDEAKKVIPGYEGGIGAGAVHVESSFLGQRVTDRLIADGNNIIIPTVGTAHEKIEALRQMLVDAGYTVELSMVDPGPTTSVNRMLSRFKITGRLIPPAYFLEAVWQPPHIFRAAQRLGRFDAYSKITSDDIRGTRVSETSGKASILARGEEFNRTGTIFSGRDDIGAGRRERITQIQGEPEGSEKLHQPREPKPPEPKFKKAPVTAPRTQERRTQVGTLGYVTKDSFAPKAAAFLKSFRKILDSYGLNGVSLDVWQDILIDGLEPVEGLYLPNLIEIAASRGDPKVTLHHEVIHALFNLALTLKEKTILLRKSHKDWITDQIKHDYSEMSRSVQAEEGVAHAYTNWLHGQKYDGVITKSFKKIQTYLKALYQALTGHDIRNADDIFRQIQSGKIGRRTQRGAGVEITKVEPLFTFGGSRAEILDRAGLMRAQDMQDAGASRDEIYDTTGFFVGHEGRWRFEINDEDAVLDMSGARENELDPHVKAKLGTLGSILRHPKLFAAYPGLASIPTTIMIRRQGYSGDYNPDPANETIEVIGRTEAEVRSILLHEVMHAVQTREDFAQGGNETMGEDFEGLEGEIEHVEARVKEMTAEWEAKAAKGDYDSKLAGKINEERVNLARKARYQYYRRIAGEVEARNVQIRDEMRKKARETGDQSYQPDAPWWTQDVNADKVVFVYSKNDTAFRATEAVPAPVLTDRHNKILAMANTKTGAPLGLYDTEAKQLVDAGLIELGTTRGATGGSNMRYFATKPTETVDMFEGPREQFVIPGAEKITDKQLAELRAAAPLRPTTGQKGTEGLPLFGDSQNQLALFKKAPSGPADPRFKLGSAPHTAGQAQQVQQGFLNRGQPVDRAIRVPFDLLGGLDEQNRWRPGKRLSDLMGPAGRQGFGLGSMIGAGVGTVAAGPVGSVAGFFAGGTVGAFILGSSPSPTGKFAWFHGIAENAKRGLIDGYGLDPEYLEVYRKSEMGKAAILREAQGVLKVLSNAGVGTTEAKVLQAVMTGENVTDADMIRLSVPIRKAIDDLGAEAVSLGLISAESFQRNRGAYLHRIYAKNEVDQSNLSGWVSARMASRRKRILGDQLKGRGLFMDVEPARLMRDVESFQKGTRGAAVLGEKFHVIDEVSTVASLQPGQPAKEKTLRRVYLPANEAVPAKYQGASWVDRGTWEVRKAGKTPTLWRDYSKAERDKMGEIVDARYTIAKTFMLMANDLSTGRFFKEVSEKQEWTKSTPPPDGQWKEASEYSRLWEKDPEIRWVKVPDTTIEKTGGKKRWGALAGKFVRAEIWRDLNEVDIANRPGTWRVLLTQWKKNKTARNPVVHMNNVMSNVMFMDLADVRTQDLVAGIAAYVKGTADFQEALDNGAFGGDMVSAEIRDQVLKPILDEISKQQVGAGNPFLKRAGIVGKIADTLWTWAKTADNGMLRAYQAEDQLFRMAAYMRRRSQGESPRVAAMNARDQFLNYDIRAPWVVMARNTLFPFISYTYRAVPKLAENIMHRPWKVAKYAAVAYAVNALAYLWDEGDDDEERERAALRTEEQGYTWLLSPRMLRMPWRDQHGLPVFLDIRRWVPAGNIFDTSEGSSALPIPAPLQFGGPLQMAFEFMLNKQAFTGEEITNELTDTNADKAAKIADWAWKAWAPSSFWTPWSWHWTKIANAIYGAKPTPDAPPYSVPQAVLSSLGIKVKPLDVENGIFWHFKDFQKVQKALKSEMRAAAYDLERGLISQSAFDKQSARIMEKFENLGRQIEEFDIRSRKKAQ